MKPTITKLTRPRLKEAIERPRLFKRLDGLCGKKIVWISAPAGSGKTTLIASWLSTRKVPGLWYQADEGDADVATFFSYLGDAVKQAVPRRRTHLPLLTREFQTGITMFTRRYFEALFSRLKPRFSFVIDNYQNVPLQSGFHEVVRDALAMAPPGMTMVIISRFDPPPVMSRLLLNGQLEIIRRNEIDFSREESVKLVAAHLRRKPTGTMLTELFRRTMGWAAGLILLAASSALGGDVSASGDIPAEQIFDYFATEVFERTDDETRTFLLMTAFLTSMTATLAAQLTDNSRADQILSRLNRNNFFTERHSTGASITYQYHPLFKAFLLHRAVSGLSRDETVRIRKKAAMLLDSAGQTDDAARLCIEIEDWDGLIALVLRHADVLMAEGRFRTVEAWIDCLPPERIERDGRLLYWKAACLITEKPSDARMLLERSYALFLSTRNPTGSFLAWAGIVNTFLYEWRNFRPLDKWINEFSTLHKRFAGFPSPEIEERAISSLFAAMMFRQPEHPDLPHWTRRVQSIVQNTPDNSHRMFIGYNLVLYWLWTGRIDEAGALVKIVSPAVKHAKAAPLPKLMWHRVMSLYHFYVLQSERGIRVVEQGLQLADATGVHLIDLSLFGVAVYHALVRGDIALSEYYLGRMTAVLHQGGTYAEIYYRSQSSLVALLRGDFESAIDHTETAMRLTEEAGVPLILMTQQATLAIILAEANQWDKVGPYLAVLRKSTEVIRCSNIEAWCSCIEAQHALQEGNDEVFRERLNSAIDVCNNTGLRMLTFLPSTLTRICAKALELNIATDFVKELIMMNNLTPTNTAEVHDSWPYPLKVYTLGGFSLTRRERPMVFSGKVQQKPLAMLKALIAMGGRDVDDQALTDALWPEADGDMGRRSFDTTLHRLRKLLNDERIIQFQNGKVSLDDKYCWVDALAFERMSVNMAIKSKIAGIDIAKLEKMAALYRGNFLPGEEAEAWALSLRERLRSKYMGAVSSLGRHWMESGEYEKSAEVFQRALEIDDLSEGFYQDLMVSYLKCGRKAEAATTYKRCRDILSFKLGLTPSDKTERIYRMLRA
jgi:LuxR family maltose regulon positive regulatory protein